MTADRALSFINELLWNAVIIGGPILGAILLVGLLVSILQVATQIQEITLSFVPKLIVAAAIMIALGPWMVSLITQFAISMYMTIPSIGRPGL
ncbi:MAG: flagellar biosynthetic protein FliQ [Pseudomonadota bacterium]